MPDSQPNKTRLLKRLSVCAAVLLVAIGLCGANTFAFSKFGTLNGPETPGRPVWISTLLVATGFLELVGGLVGAIGFALNLVLLLVYWIRVTFMRNRH